jgi:hypothetical protein
MRAHKLDMIIAMKPAVDKARREKEWVSANHPVNQDFSVTTNEFLPFHLVNEDFFVTTNEFLPFMDANNFVYPGRAARAVLLTLAVVAGSWPPSPEVIKEIMKLLREKIRDPRERTGRAPEIVIAYLLGWPRPDLNGSAARWESALPEARACLRAVMYVSTDSCLTWLNRFVISFPTEDPGYWATRIFNLFTSAHPDLRCHCFLRVSPTGTTASDIEDLTGNAKRKAITCLLREHHLSLWNPLELPLWSFAERAVKGFIGEFTSRCAGGFPKGMLYDLLWRSGQRPGRVALVKVARRYCDSCKRWTVYRFCPSRGCDQRRLVPQHAHVSAQELLILQGEAGGFSPKRVWTCVGLASALAAEARGQTANRCGNIYIHECCDLRKCSEFHDCCPLCGTQHPTGRQRKLSEVYFYEALVVREVSTNNNQALASAAPAENEFPAHVITEAAEDALEELAGRGQWIMALIFCLEEDFGRWIGLVQSVGEVAWDDLWDALKDAPDRPANPEDLRRVFVAKVWPTLSAIFKFKFGLAGLDWRRVENHRPQRTRGKEEGQE